MVATLAFILTLVVLKVEAFKLSQPLSWEVEDELLQLKDRLGLESSTISSEPIPVYRKDLDKDYIAYWYIEIGDREYVVVSTGEKTGDRRLNQQGHIPSPVTRMLEIAANSSNDCNRFYMLTPEGDMFCENGDARVVAATIDDRFLARKKTNITIDIIHDIITKHLATFGESWKQMALQIKKEGDWAAIAVYDAINDKYTKLEKDLSEAIFGDDDEMFVEEAISPGDSVKISVSASTTNMKIRFIPEVSMTAEYIRQSQAQLCKVLVDLCTGTDDISYTSIQKTQSGEQYIVVELVDDFKFLSETLQDQDLGFQIEMYLEDGKVVVRRFGFDLTVNHRQKRQAGAADDSYEIHNKNIFPSYIQHEVENCLTSSGAVAWAMVFGYYDRLSNEPLNFGFKPSFFRCGADGTAGSDSCVADAILTDRMEHFIEYIDDLLEPDCMFHSGEYVKLSHMDNVQDFFVERADDADAHVNLERTEELPTIWNFDSNDYAIFPRRHAADYVFEIIKNSQIPVVVGFMDWALTDVRRWSWWSWSWVEFWEQVPFPRYGVATAVQKVTVQQRWCRWYGCGPWETTEVYQMKVYDGEGQTGDVWRDISVFFSAAAFPH
ncbi:uncharacterized protein LOC144442351 [Glandiceps talaboti]